MSVLRSFWRWLCDRDNAITVVLVLVSMALFVWALSNIRVGAP